ncbi:MAG: phosphotransferase [[Bacteroides] pectinophilus]|nr:phosphotransferase [[Bacteroides] pectinophilus]
MAFEDRTVTDRLAEDVLPLYGWQYTHRARLMMVSENASYAIVNRMTGSTDAVLRISRPGYHTLAELVSEVRWIDALAVYGHGINPAKVLPSLNKSCIQSIIGNDGVEYYCIMFEYIDGVCLEECSDEKILECFEALGRMTARMHIQSASWKDIVSVHRMHFDYDNIIGEHADWGRWQDRSDIDGYTASVMAEASDVIKLRLSEYGINNANYGLIHADMRLANIIIANDDNSMRIIDFDDCGFGWFVSDFAASVSFMEEKAIVPYLKDAWLNGYTGVRPLSDRDAAMTETFVMMRRLQLTAWMAGHPESSPVKLYKENWIENTKALAQKYIS